MFNRITIGLAAVLALTAITAAAMPRNMDGRIRERGIHPQFRGIWTIRETSPPGSDRYNPTPPVEICRAGAHRVSVSIGRKTFNTSVKVIELEYRGSYGNLIKFPEGMILVETTGSRGVYHAVLYDNNGKRGSVIITIRD